MLQWDKLDERYYEHGVDRGVLYIPGKNPIPWNGITGVEEGSNGASSVLYRDGVIYLAEVDASDHTAQMTALFFPDEFGVCLGIPQATDGFFVDNQKPKRFGLSYRSLIGNGTKGDMFGYQIHLVYNAMASIGTRSRKTIGEGTEPVEFNFDLVCTPVKLPGYRPSAHYIIDTRNMSPSTIAELEDILYGDGETPGTLPDPVVLYDLMNFGDTIIVTDHGDGTFSIEGSHDNVYMTDAIRWQVDNINAIDHEDGTYTINGTDDPPLGVFTENFESGHPDEVGWSRVGVVVGDESSVGGGMQTSLTAGEMYVRDLPDFLESTDDFEVEVEWNPSTNTAMAGPFIIGAAAYSGAGATMYSSPSGVLVTNIAAGTYSGAFEAAGGAMDPVRLRIRKQGTNYYGAQSNNGGDTWVETAAFSQPGFTAARVGFGAWLGTQVPVITEFLVRKL
jgi:hypothetical protein